MRLSGLEKQKAREWAVHLFFTKTGMTKLLPGKQFWELCWEQLDPNSSFHQFCELHRLFTPDQYRGVDRDATIVERNSQFFKNSVKFIHGEWTTAIREAAALREFNPQLIYLDTEVAVENAARLAAETMVFCPRGTVLVVNMVSQLVYKGRKQYEVEDFLTPLGNILPSSTLKEWDAQADVFPYTGDRKVRMLQIGMYRP